MDLKIRYKIVPGQSVGPLTFGMARQEVRNAMHGIGVSLDKGAVGHPNIDYFYNAAFQVWYDDFENMVGVELANDLNINVTRDQIESNSANAFDIDLNGRNPFTIKASEAISFISSFAGEVDGSEQDYRIQWPSVGLGVWRRGLEKDMPSGEEYLECEYISSLIVKKV